MTPQEAIEHFGLRIVATFIPFSQSRNRAEKTPSLNWHVTLNRHDIFRGEVQPAFRAIWQGNYSAGCAHCPSYRPDMIKHTVTNHERTLMVAWECEHGRKATGVASGQGLRVYGPNAGPHIQPDLKNVVYSLLLDASAIDEGSFEEWASSLGFDPDSKSAEATYRACVDTGLKLRAALGEDGLAELRAAFNDY